MATPGDPVDMSLDLLRRRRYFCHAAAADREGSNGRRTGLRATAALPRADGCISLSSHLYSTALR